jgi:hypothetical protein
MFLHRHKINATAVRTLLWKCAALAIFFALLCSQPAAAQTTFARLTGTVTDAQGAVISGAQIEATHVASNYAYRTQSNQAGNYTLAQLREGEYTVRATAPGFNDFEAKDVRLVALDVRRIDISLTVGTVQSTVEVTAGATVIETETARISDTRSSHDIKALPVARYLWNYLSLSPGVTTSTEGAFRRFAGSRLNQSSTSIDGISADDLKGGAQISPLVGYVESYAEVRIDSVNNSAEFGTIGNVTVVSKSGTNQLHASAVDFYSTPVFRARNPFAQERGTGVFHAPNFTVGGPVWIPKVYNGRDRTFFFFSFETSRGSAVQQLLNPTVPLARWREGDFSSLLPGTAIRNPFTGQPYPNNIIPTSQLNPVVQKIQDRFYPLPNFGDTSVLQNQNYREMKIRERDSTTVIGGRGDHRFTDKLAFFSRFTWQWQYNRPYQSNLPTVGQQESKRRTRGVSSSLSYAARPNLLYEVRYGLNFNNQPFAGPVNGKQLISDLGIQGLFGDIPDIPGILNVSFSGLPIQGLSQTNYQSPGNSQIAHFNQQSLSWFRGRHGIKVGFGFAYVDWASYQAAGNLFGSVQFSNRFTGHAYSDFLHGIPTTMSRASAPLFLESLRNAYDFFVQDDFKVTPRLTLNLGLRYEYHPYWHEKQGLFSNFDIATGSIVVPDGALSKVSPFFPEGFAPIVEASTLGYPSQTLIRSDKNNIAPRIGIAYRPWGSTTVIRAGYGIFFNNAPATMNHGSSPFLVSEPSYTNPTGNPNVILPLVFPQSGAGTGSAGIPTSYPLNLMIPYSMQYSFTVEQQVGNTGIRASYVGTNTRQGVYRYNINQPVPDSRPFVQKERLFPRYAAVNHAANGTGHQYNGLTVEAKRPMARGLMFETSWMWARDIGDLNDMSAPENAYDLKRERAPWVDIPTHRFTGSMIYNLPFGKGRPFLSNANRAVDGVLGGWELSVIGIKQTGQFLTPTWSGPDPTGTAYTTSATPANVTIRPDILYNPNLPSDQRTVGRWFDPAAFTAPARGRFGTSAKGVIIGPGVDALHVSIAKEIVMYERLRLRPQLAAFNILNHPNYSNPNTSITSAPGVISGIGLGNDLDSTGPRSLSLSLRLDW